MSVGVVFLLVLAVLVYFGVLHRVLDRMRLDDRTALFIIFLTILGSFFNVNIGRTPPLSVNLGGAVVPLGVTVYLLVTADTRREKVRGSVAALVAGAAIYLSMKLLDPEEQTMLVDPTYFFAVVAGVVGYLAGRSRRAAYIAGTAGVVLADVAHYVETAVRGLPAATAIGGAGAFDAVVIAGLLAVVLAEVVGETREFMARGPARRAGGPGAGRRGPQAGGPARERRAHSPEGGGESFVAAFGIAGGSGRGSRSRDSHRAGRRRSRAESRRGSRAGFGGVTEPAASVAPGTGVDLGPPAGAGTPPDQPGGTDHA